MYQTKNQAAGEVLHNKTVYNLNYLQKKYFSSSYILFTNSNDNSNTSEQSEENNTSQQSEEDNTYGPKTFVDSEIDKLAVEQDRLSRGVSYIAQRANEAGENRMEVTSRIDAIRDDLHDSGDLSHTTLERLDKNKEKYDELDQKINKLIEEEEEKEGDTVKSAYFTRYQNECITNRHLKDINILLGDRNVHMEDREHLGELENRIKKCQEDDVRLSEYDIEYIKESIDLDEKSAELYSMKRSLEGYSEENMYSSSDEKMSYSSDENRAPSSDENRVPTTEESSKVDKSKSTEEDSSSVDKGKATEEGSTKEDKGKRKATEEEAYEGETKRSRVDAPSSDENRGSLIDDYADVSTEMPSYMDPDDG